MNSKVAGGIAAQVIVRTLIFAIDQDNGLAVNIGDVGDMAAVGD